MKGATLGAVGAGVTGGLKSAQAAAEPQNRRAGQAVPASPVRTLLSFATEAAHALEDHDFIRDIALFLTKEGLVANFHLTGDYARALKRHGRADVVEALKPHEIGFHCNHHGSRPFMPGYLEKLSWDDGVTRWLGYEAPGLAAVTELMDRRPTYYTTEFAKAPQTIFGSALLGTGIMGYAAVPMREHSAVWFCNSFVPSVENIVALESFHAPGDREKVARQQLDAAVAAQGARGKDILRVFLHSYKYYAEPPYDRLTMTREIYKDDSYYFEDYPSDYPKQSKERFLQSFEMFKRTIRHHARQSEFIRFSEHRAEYQSNTGIWIELPELDLLCRFLTRAIDAYATAQRSVSPAEAFGLLVRVLRVWSETGQLPSRVFVRNVIGPTGPIAKHGADRKVQYADFRTALPIVDRELEISGALPVTAKVGGFDVGPGQFLRGLIQLYLGIRSGQKPGDILLSGENLPEISREVYFQEVGFTRKGLYPDDFTGRSICALSLAQSWSWKPAVKVRQQPGA